MITEETIDEKILKVKTGQDLIDLGEVPKTSSQMMKLLTYQRLIALRDASRASMTPEVIGKWKSLFEENEIPEMKDEEGNITQEASVTYSLSSGVVADNNLGHKIRVTEELSYGRHHKIPAGAVGKIISYQEDKHTNAPKKILAIFEETFGSQTLEFNLGDFYRLEHFEVSSLGQTEPLVEEQEVKREALEDFLPTAVYSEEKAMELVTILLMGRDFVMPGSPGTGKTLSGKDAIKIGKTQKYLATVEGCKSQCHPASLHDEEYVRCTGNDACAECKSNYDSNYLINGTFTRPKPEDVRVVIKNFSQGNGIERLQGNIGTSVQELVGFKMPRLIDGLAEVTIMEKIFELEEEQLMEELSPSKAKYLAWLKQKMAPYDQNDPRGFQPGFLGRTNNGILFVDEIEKFRGKTLDALLSALEDEQIFPDQIRHAFPAHALIIATTNDYGKLSEPLRDRLLQLRLERPDDPDVTAYIDKVATHPELREEKAVYGDSVHQDKAIDVNRIPTPEVLRRAKVRLYNAFHSGAFTSQGKEMIMGSTRSSKDASRAARAKLLIDQIFHEDTAPSIVKEDQLKYGIKFAMSARINQQKYSSHEKVKSDISTFVEENFDKYLKEEENTYWCRFNKDIAIMDLLLDVDIKANLTAELAVYNDEGNYDAIWQSYQDVKNAYDHPDDLLAMDACSRLPFMDHLITDQPRSLEYTKDEIVELVNYMLQSYQRSECNGC